MINDKTIGKMKMASFSLILVADLTPRSYSWHSFKIVPGPDVYEEENPKRLYDRGAEVFGFNYLYTLPPNVYDKSSGILTHEALASDCSGYAR